MVGIIIAVVVFLVASQGGGSSLPGIGGAGGGYDTSAFADTGRYAGCETGEDANQSADCARVAVENSLTDFWADELGSRFRPEKRIVTFSGGIDTGGCGAATSDVGPFYCSADETIYLDDSFFEDVLVDVLDGPRGAFVEPYVLAHEYGHHISNLIGTLARVTGETGPQSSGVRLELQADCFAGRLDQARHRDRGRRGRGAAARPEPGGHRHRPRGRQDRRRRLHPAAERRAGNEEVWTHGSSDQRRKWFMVGYDQGTMEACDTFDIDRV